MRIFLVEDSPVLSAHLTELIHDVPGAKLVGQAADAPTAIARIAELTPDVAILDVSLKTGTGFDVLKALPALASRPVAIMFTNYVSPPVRHFAAKNGADYFFDKARDIALLLDTLGALARDRFGLRSSPSM